MNTSIRYINTTSMLILMHLLTFLSGNEPSSEIRVATHLEIREFGGKAGGILMEKSLKFMKNCQSQI